MLRGPYILLAGFLTTVVPNYAVAQEEPAEPEGTYSIRLVSADDEGEIIDEFALLQEEAMVESAARHKQEIGMSPSAITVITREDIEASGANGFADLLRLVPGMDPKDICNRLERYLKKVAPKSVRVKIDTHGGARAVEVPTDSPWLVAASRAIKAGFGKEPVFMKEGGSIPIVIDFKSTLGLDTLLIGFGQNDDNIHSPNERFRIADFERGCKTAAALPAELARVRSK